MDAIITAVTLIGAGVYGLLLLFVHLRAADLRGDRWLVTVLLLAAALALGVRFLAMDTAFGAQSGRVWLTLILLPGLWIFYGLLIVQDIFKEREIFNRRAVPLAILGVIWLLALLIAAQTSAPFAIGTGEWLIAAMTAPNALSLVVLGGLAIAGIYLLTIAFYGFYTARMPEVANRALFWALDSGLFTISLLLVISGEDVLLLVGTLMQISAVSGAVYAMLSHRVMDIRSEIGAVTRTFTLALIAAFMIYGAVMLSRNLEEGSERAPLVYAILALAVGLIIIPLQRLVDSALRRVMSDPHHEATEAARRYSQAIAAAQGIDQLSETVARSLNKALRLRRSGLMLVELLKDAPLAEVTLKYGDGREAQGFVRSDGPFYRQLHEGRAAFTQFDVEYAPEFRALGEDERYFLRSLQVSAYAPVFAENNLVGVLAAGPKLNDAPFYPQDLQVLRSMASQTAVALRNAQLIGEMQQMAREVEALNERMGDSQAQIERLEQVKGEFVTIASHELRTPLAQIRGYIDILDALNQGGALDQDQTTGMVLNLRRATERMEELIGAMLDASQLDTGAMELRFTPTSLESILRMAIEPLTDSIKQRRLTLAARGLRSLPTVQADSQRLVQAFRNVILNAIKFTPDGGRIDVTAAVQPAGRPGMRDQVLITVADSGVGIDHENLELIFLKFYRAYDPGLHSTGATKFMGAGPGLGLTIARGIIERHGGRIWAESAGHNMETFPGTTVYILIPVTTAENGNGSPNPHTQATGETSVVQSGS